MLSIIDQIKDFKKRLSNWLDNNDYLFNYLILISIAGFIIPYTSNSHLYLSWINGIKSFNNGGFQLLSNPIWLVYLIFVTWIQFGLESLFPLIFGSNNVFLLRFLLKAPILLFFILIFRILTKNLFSHEINNDPRNLLGILLIITPLFYLSFILGSTIVIGLFFYLSYYIEATKEEKDPKQQGVLIGLAVLFSFIFLLLIIPKIISESIYKSKKQTLEEILSFLLFFMIIQLPYVIWGGEIVLVSQNTIYLGFSILQETITSFLLNINVFSILNIILSGLGLSFACGFIIYHLRIKGQYHTEVPLIFSFSLLFLFPFLTIDEGITLLLIINIETLIIFSNKMNSPIISRILIGCNILVVIFALLLLYFIYPANEIFHVDIIRLFSITKLNEQLDVAVRKSIVGFNYFLSMIFLAILMRFALSKKNYRIKNNLIEAQKIS